MLFICGVYSKKKNLGFSSFVDLEMMSEKSFISNDILIENIFEKRSDKYTELEINLKKINDFSKNRINNLL